MSGLRDDAGLTPGMADPSARSTTDFVRIVARVPRLITILGVAGGIATALLRGIGYGTAFLIGAVAAYVNFRVIERLVTALVRRVLAKPVKHPRLQGAMVFIQLALFLIGLFVILRFSGFNLTAFLFGFLVCPAAVMIESVYFLLITYGHS